MTVSSVDSPEDAADAAFATAAMAALRESGPLSLEQWALALGEFGSVDEIAEVLELLDDPMVGFLPGDKYVALDALLEGLVFTHRLSDIEISANVLEASPDLDPILGFVNVTDGLRVVEVEYETELLNERGFESAGSRRVVILPPSSLADYSAGDLVGLAVEDGQLTLRAAEVEDEPDLAPVLGKIFAANGVEALDSASWQLLIEDPELFTVPSPPLGELFEAAGYEHQRELLAERGFDFIAYDVQLRTASVASRYSLGHDEAATVVAFVDLADRGYTDAAIDNFDVQDWARRHIAAVPDSFASLADPGVAVAVFDLGFRNQDLVTDTILEALGLELTRQGQRALKPAAHWLAGKAADRLGRVLEAETHYEKSLEWEADWGPALFELAQFASDRGDVNRALSLLGRIDGGTQEVLHEVLQAFLPVEHLELGRNDKCWCGSGRKYKVCHLGKIDESILEDGRWLYKKACMFAFASEFADRLVELDNLASVNLSEDALRSRTIFEGPALDVALFEDGLFAEFLTRRGELLSEKDLATATEWLGTRRSVYDVNSEGTALVDRRTGETVKVGAAGQAGDVLSARILVAGSTTQAVGGVVLTSDQQVADVLRVLAADVIDPVELVTVLS
ncbi:SEC-C domain-containing protein [Rhodococcus sp. OK302]|uniref:SEC-C domain-containing protein n=1 Tax=Rhodococcus sp. OK302 TaxID=1882769 RepID=UPI0020CCD26D|nr:SEC-C metal-binding domain-containing protein [Rhodococcus sp. OK302]